jgi:hypothetical protein
MKNVSVIKYKNYIFDYFTQLQLKVQVCEN